MKRHKALLTWRAALLKELADCVEFAATVWRHGHRCKQQANWNVPTISRVVGAVAAPFASQIGNRVYVGLVVDDHNRLVVLSVCQSECWARQVLVGLPEMVLVIYGDLPRRGHSSHKQLVVKRVHEAPQERRQRRRQNKLPPPLAAARDVKLPPPPPPPPLIGLSILSYSRDSNCIVT